MATKPLKLSEIRKRLTTTLENVRKSNSAGLEKAAVHLETLEADLRLRLAAEHHDVIFDFVSAARKALGVGKIEETEVLISEAIEAAEGKVTK